MATDKYDLHTIDYSVQGWDAILATDMEKLDDVIHSRGKGTAGETIAQYDAVYLEADGKFDKALADGMQQPAWGLAIESAVLDDGFRFQRSGPITNAGWSWATIGAKIYLDASTPGALTDVEPGSNIQMVGIALSSTSIFIWISTMEGAGASDVTNPLSSQLQVGEFDIKLDSLLSVDSAGGTYSGITCDGVLGATLAFGDLVYLNTTDKRWEPTDAHAEATAGDVMLAIVLAAGNDGDTRLLLLQGFVREDTWNFTSYGRQSLFVSCTAGDMTQTAPSGSGDIVRVIGHVSTIDDQIYFNPSGTWLEI